MTAPRKWIGKRVVAIPSGAFGGYAELAVGPAAMAFEMPPESELAHTPAAAVYFPFHLSWLALHERARLQAGETVLIHAAAGGTRLRRHPIGQRGRSSGDRHGRIPEAKLDLCRSLGASVAINYRDGDFADAVLQATDGRGVDVAFDSVGGEVTTKTFRCMAFNGRHLLVGFACQASKRKTKGSFRDPRCCSGTSPSSVSATPTSTTPPRLEGNDRLLQLPLPPPTGRPRSMHVFLELVANGSVRPVVGSRSRLHRPAPRALQAMADRQTIGRTVILVD